MGFSVRMAPGVRVRVSSRGVRTSIGPRAARLHVGGGSPGFSTGAGPVSLYTGLGSGRTPAGSGGGVAASIAAASRQEQIDQLLEVYARLAALHRETFTTAQRPIAAASRTVDEAAIRKWHREEHLRGVSVFARARRRQALADGEAAATAAIVQKHADLTRERETAQRSLDQLWARLMANDPDVVMATLTAAFGDNEAAAAPLDVNGAEATLLVVVPTASAMPAKKPALTPTGRPTLKAVPKKEAADWHKTAVCGSAFATVKEAFAVAPGLTAARIVAVALPSRDSSGAQQPEVLLAARFERQGLEGVRWSEVDAIHAINDTTSELQLRQVGVTKALMPLDLTTEPQLTDLLQQFDYDDLTND